MRRRRPVSVWPALADLMTVLAVVGLFLAVSLLPAMEEKGDLIETLAEAQERLQVLEEELASSEEEREEAEERWAEERENLKVQLREAARNEEMFSAIQEAQRLVNEISSDRALQFTADQTLQFGDDLVSFERNRYEPLWQPAGKEKLRRFCRTLKARLDGGGPDGEDLYDLFTVHVEGHTDSTRCPGDPNCNWWLSGRRAAEFMSLMRDEELCPGGEKFQLRPIGYADSKPYFDSKTGRKLAIRRIALRLKPEYSKILEYQEAK